MKFGGGRTHAQLVQGQCTRNLETQASRSSPCPWGVAVQPGLTCKQPMDRSMEKRGQDGPSKGGPEEGLDRWRAGRAREPRASERPHGGHGP